MVNEEKKTSIRDGRGPLFDFLEGWSEETLLRVAQHLLDRPGKEDSGVAHLDMICTQAINGEFLLRGKWLSFKDGKVSTVDPMPKPKHLSFGDVHAGYLAALAVLRMAWREAGRDVFARGMLERAQDTYFWA